MLRRAAGIAWLMLSVVSPLGAQEALDLDPKSFGKTPQELWNQVDDYFLSKQWIQTCARLDRLRDLGEDLKKAKQKAGYAYVRCASVHLRLKNLTATDSALELAREFLVGDKEINPVEAELHRVLARIALEKGDLAQAQAHFELAMSKNRDAKADQADSVALAKFARHAYDADNTKEATEATKLALEMYPENRDAQKILEHLTFWSRTGWIFVAVALLLLLGVAALQLRKKVSSAPTYGS